MQEFENFIIKCCEMDEWDLRAWLKETLAAAGFKVQEDDYKSYRGGRYQEIHNMLAIRGDKPPVCLVAHTDVCRDHNSYMAHRKAEPVVKEVDRYGKLTRIIQDKNCKVQVGGDDRLGVAINTWIALHNSYDMGLLFTSDEEIGALSADEARFPELKEFELLAQVDRGNRSDQLVTNIYGTNLCDEQTANRLLALSEEIELPRYRVSGLLTDVLALVQNKMAKNAVNMTCGYHNSIGSSPDEYIVVQEAFDTMVYVSAIIEDYLGIMHPVQESTDATDTMSAEEIEVEGDEAEEYDIPIIIDELASMESAATL